MSLDQLRHKTVRGTIWVTLISLLAIPLSQYRAWALNRFDETGYVVGAFAVLLLFVEMISTFFIYGAGPVMSYNLPKLDDRRDRANFILAYVIISLSLLSVFYLLVVAWPDLLPWMLRTEASGLLYKLLLILAPLVFLWQVTSFVLAGLMAFRLSAVLARAQTVIMCVWATVALMLFPESVRQRPMLWVGSVFAVGILLLAVFGMVYCARHLGRPSRPRLPKNFWRFSIPIHLNTITSFIFRKADQWIVLATVDVAALGVYFIFTQITMVITFVPRRVMGVTMTTFSKLLHDGNNEAAGNGFRRLTEITAHLAFFSTMGLLSLAWPLMGVFGDKYQAWMPQFLLLAWLGYVGCMGSCNVSVITASGRTVLFTVLNWILVGIQIGVSLVLLPEFEGQEKVWAVIVGRGAGLLFIQTALWWVVLTRVREFPARIPGAYFIGLMLVSGQALLTWQCHEAWYWPLAGGLVATMLYAWLTKFRPWLLLREFRRPHG